MAEPTLADYLQGRRNPLLDQYWATPPSTLGGADVGRRPNALMTYGKGSVQSIPTQEPLGQHNFVSNAWKRDKLARRFWAKISKCAPDDCWPWIAKSKVSLHGYGALNIGGVVIGAHRIAWVLHNGQMPNGAVIRHSCDNPKCCNPAHLLAGTHADNNRDMYERGRGRTGMKHSAEARRKIAEARAKNPPKQSEAVRLAKAEELKKRWADPAWRERFRALTSGPNNSRYGKRPPEHQLEAVRRAARARKGFKHSEETKQKMSEAARGRPARKGYRLSEETRQRMRVAALKREEAKRQKNASV